MKLPQFSGVWLFVALVVGLVTAVIVPSCMFIAGVSDSLRGQQGRNDAVMPLLHATVVAKIKVGDTAEHAKKVLADAGLEFAYDPLSKRWDSGYRTSPHSSIMIRLYVDGERISKVEVQPWITGP